LPLTRQHELTSRKSRRRATLNSHEKYFTDMTCNLNALLNILIDLSMYIVDFYRKEELVNTELN